MNKRGEDILVPEGMKIILAVICVLFLIYLAVIITGLMKNRIQDEQAQETLEQIINRVNVIKTGESEEFLYLAPKSWSITSKAKDEIEECKYQNCLCLCQDTECEDLNICKESKFFIKTFREDGSILAEHELNSPSLLILKNESRGFSLTLKNEAKK